MFTSSQYLIMHCLQQIDNELVKSNKLLLQWFMHNNLVHVLYKVLTGSNCSLPLGSSLALTVSNILLTLPISAPNRASIIWIRKVSLSSGMASFLIIKTPVLSVCPSLNVTLFDSPRKSSDAEALVTWRRTRNNK